MGLAEDLTEILRRQDEIKKSRPFTVYTSSDMYNLMDATVKGDEEKANSIANKISERDRLSKERDMALLRETLSQEDYGVFVHIDSHYKSINPNTITSYRDMYTYSWIIHEFTKYFEELDHVDHNTVWCDFHKGVYSLYISGEDGGYAGYTYIGKDISAEEIISKIEEVKNTYKSS